MRRLQRKKQEKMLRLKRRKRQRYKINLIMNSIGSSVKMQPVKRQRTKKNARRKQSPISCTSRV